jgi:hypothetical protein
MRMEKIHTISLRHGDLSFKPLAKKKRKESEQTTTEALYLLPVPSL